MKKLSTVLLGLGLFVSSALYAAEANKSTTQQATHMGDHMHEGKMMNHMNMNDMSNEEMKKNWTQWFIKWKSLIEAANQPHEEISQRMKLVNPKYTLREWFLVPAYQLAKNADYSLIHELQEIMTNPYSEQSQEIEEKYYRLKPSQFFAVGGISHVSCSS